MKEQILKMEKEIEKLKLENKEKEDALIELSQYYKNKNEGDAINEEKNEEGEN